MDLTISNKWDQYLDSFEEGDKDLYYKEEYVKLYETDSEKGVCCIAKQGDNIMLFPYLERTFTYFGKTFHEFYCSICEKWEAENPEKAQRYGRFLLRYKY